MIEMDKPFMSEYGLGKQFFLDLFDVEGTIWLRVRPNVVQMSRYQTEKVKNFCTAQINPE